MFSYPHWPASWNKACLTRMGLFIKNYVNKCFCAYDEQMQYTNKAIAYSTMCSCQVPRPPPFLPSIYVHTNTLEQKRSKNGEDACESVISGWGRGEGVQLPKQHTGLSVQTVYRTSLKVSRYNSTCSPMGVPHSCDIMDIVYAGKFDREAVWRPGLKPPN